MVVSIEILPRERAVPQALRPSISPTTRNESARRRYAIRRDRTGGDGARVCRNRLGFDGLGRIDAAKGRLRAFVAATRRCSTPNELSIGDEGQVASVAAGTEEVLRQYLVPLALLAPARLRVALTGQARGPAAARNVTFRLRAGGAVDQPDGNALLTVQDVGPGDHRGVRLGGVPPTH